MNFESTHWEVTTSDRMEDCWERALDERTPFDPMGDWSLDVLKEALAELPF